MKPPYAEDEKNKIYPNPSKVKPAASCGVWKGLSTTKTHNSKGWFTMDVLPDSDVFIRTVM